jgi:hypothetical protein
MNDNEVILSLLNLYKSKGIDLHYLLDSSIFVRLPMATQIAMIKQYAGQIAAGMHTGFGKPEVRRAMWDVVPAGIAGGATGYAAAKGIAAAAGRSVHPLAIALAALTGAGIGTGVAYMRNADAVADKDSLKRQLELTAKHPSSSNALHALEMNNIAKGNRSYEREVVNPYLQKVLNKAPQWGSQYAVGATKAINKLNK